MYRLKEDGVHVELIDDTEEEVYRQWGKWRDSSTHLFNQSTSNDYLTAVELQRAQRIKDKLVLHQFARDLTKYIEGDGIVKQDELVKMLEEGVIDSTQAHLIFEIFNDRILEKNMAKEGFFNELMIMSDFFPVIAFIEFMFFILICAIVNVMVDMKFYMGNGIELRVIVRAFFSYIVLFHLDKNGYSHLASCIFFSYTLAVSQILCKLISFFGANTETLFDEILDDCSDAAKITSSIKYVLFIWSIVAVSACMFMNTWGTQFVDALFLGVIAYRLSLLIKIHA